LSVRSGSEDGNTLPMKIEKGLEYMGEDNMSIAEKMMIALGMASAPFFLSMHP
jgi:hypothetical protein